MIAASAELPDSPTRELRLSLIVAGLFFIGFLGLLALVPLDAGAVANGVVTVAGHRQAVQHRDGGIISKLYVSEGQRVTKGQLLLVISASDPGAVERGTAAEVYTLLAQRERLKAEVAGLPAVPEPPEYAGLSAADRALADASLKEQRQLFAARRSSKTAQKGVLRQRMRQANEQINGLSSQMTANRTQHQLLDDQLTGLRQLQEKGFVSKNQIRELERAQAQLDGDFGAGGAQIARAREAGGEFSMQSVTLDRQMIEEAATQLRDVYVQLNELFPKLGALREQLARAEVRAPASGRVVGLSVFTVGGVVAPGATLMDIVPEKRALLIDAMVSPHDAYSVRPGQVAQIRFPAISQRSAPLLAGTVTNLSADSFTDDKTGMRYFRAEVSVPEGEIRRLTALDGGRDAIQAGLQAQLMIPLRKRSALEYLFEPLVRSLWLAGRED